MKVIGLAGWSGAGKTTLIAKLLPALIAQGLRVSTIKHAHHAFDLDKPGKDSWVHRQSGASEVLIASGRRWALMHELRSDDESSLLELLDKLSDVDLVLVEGFKSEPFPKIEIYRAGNGKPALFPDDRTIIGIAADALVSTSLPVVHLDDVTAISAMVLQSAVEREALRRFAPISRDSRIDRKTTARSSSETHISY